MEIGQQRRVLLRVPDFLAPGPPALAADLVVDSLGRSDVSAVYFHDLPHYAALSQRHGILRHKSVAVVEIHTHIDPVQSVGGIVAGCAVGVVVYKQFVAALLAGIDKHGLASAPVVRHQDIAVAVPVHAAADMGHIPVFRLIGREQGQIQIHFVAVPGQDHAGLIFRQARHDIGVPDRLLLPHFHFHIMVQIPFRMKLHCVGSRSKIHGQLAVLCFHRADALAAVIARALSDSGCHGLDRRSADGSVFIGHHIHTGVGAECHRIFVSAVFVHCQPITVVDGGGLELYSRCQRLPVQLIPFHFQIADGIVQIDKKGILPIYIRHGLIEQNIIRLPVYFDLFVRYAVAQRIPQNALHQSHMAARRHSVIGVVRRIKHLLLHLVIDPSQLVIFRVIISLGVTYLHWGQHIFPDHVRLADHAPAHHDLVVEIIALPHFAGCRIGRRIYRIPS